MYSIGLDVPRDDAEAIRWFHLAAEQGDALAQPNLGQMYFNGRGVPQDDVSAHMWLNLAAATGDEDARKARELVAARMTREQIAEAQARARSNRRHPSAIRLAETPSWGHSGDRLVMLPVNSCPVRSVTVTGSLGSTSD